MTIIEIRGIRSGEVAYAVIDDADEATVRQSKWFLGTDGYARRYATKRERAGGAPIYIALHRQLFGIHLTRGKPGDPEIDHKSGDRLDNRRENLRVVARRQNCMNAAGHGRSKFVGVSFFKPARLWRAYIGINGKRKELGYFKTELAAARARDKAARKHYGEHARINLPEVADV